MFFVTITLRGHRFWTISDLCYFSKPQTPAVNNELWSNAPLSCLMGRMARFEFRILHREKLPLETAWFCFSRFFFFLFSHPKTEWTFCRNFNKARGEKPVMLGAPSGSTYKHCSWFLSRNDTPNEPTNKPMNQPNNQPNNQWTNHRTNQINKNTLPKSWENKETTTTNPSPLCCYDPRLQILLGDDPVSSVMPG